MPVATSHNGESKFTISNNQQHESVECQCPCQLVGSGASVACARLICTTRPAIRDNLCTHTQVRLCACVVVAVIVVIVAVADSNGPGGGVGDGLT